MLPGSMYYRVKGGSTCDRIKSKEECNWASKKLSLSDTSASEEETSDWPPNCYLHNYSSLYFNKKKESTSKCDSSSKVCICKKTACKQLYAGLTPLQWETLGSRHRVQLRAKKVCHQKFDFGMTVIEKCFDLVMCISRKVSDQFLT